MNNQTFHTPPLSQSREEFLANKKARTESNGLANETKPIVSQNSNTGRCTDDEVVFAMPKVDPLQRLIGMSINNDLEKRRKMETSTKYAMKGIAPIGQWTVLYASPNTGKTLITLKLLCEQMETDLKNHTVIYANCDDTFSGANDKVELVGQRGIAMLVPGTKGFETSHLADHMTELANAGKARKAVIVLDTLKKFTDLMDKRTSSEFGRVCRNFVSAGGTIIALAHANKRTSAGGAVYGGTSDIVDDADCAFVIERNCDGEQDVALQAVPRGEQVVKFSNLKNRAPVVSTASFGYDNSLDGYHALFGSVRRLDNSEALEAEKKAKKDQYINENIQAITEALRLLETNGEMLQSDLSKQVSEAVDITPEKMRKVIKRLTGKNWGDGSRWSVRIGERNSHYYTALRPPAPEID